MSLTITKQNWVFSLYEKIRILFTVVYIQILSFKPHTSHYMQTAILKRDIDLIKKLDVHYPDLTMRKTISAIEREHFKNVKSKLKYISDYFKNKYDEEYGIFKSEVATGNPIGRGGGLRRVWSGIFKGSSNKQYSAQISFVINTSNNCLDVGFYFGRASVHMLEKGRKQELEAQLKKIGEILHTEIMRNSALEEKYYTLYDYGFKAEHNDIRIDAETWLSNLTSDPAYSSVTFSLYPNDLGYIDLTTIDLYVAMVMPLMTPIPEDVSLNNIHKKRSLKPLTPEQRAKQAELRTLIGLHGEEYVMTYEKDRLKDLNISENYPSHLALVADNFGYDILSYDEHIGEIFIEVKTTTRLKHEYVARQFYMSIQEYAFYMANKEKYRLYRVYDIYGTPNVELIDMSNVEPKIDCYKITIP